MHRLLRRHAARAAVIGLLVVSSAACGGSAAPSEVTESLGGVLSSASSSWHIFNTSGPGDVTITLVSLSPLSAITVGIGIGIASGSTCNLQYKSEVFKADTTWTTSLGAKGAYCVAIYDIGQVSKDVTYKLSVMHP
jgi:hypothetical protein